MSVYVIKLLVVLSYCFMVLMNALANILPINGIGTGAVSDSYPNLFAPAGFTFAIWGVIYLLLLIAIVYWVSRSPSVLLRQSSSFYGLSWALIVSSLGNGVWILAWHYRMIALSLALMVLILVCLIIAMASVKRLNWHIKQLAFIKPAIGVYFGWITVATIANVTTLLVDLKWQGFGISEPVWLMVMLLVGALVGGLTIRWSQCGAYGLVLLWAYGGILAKHLSPSGFNGAYPNVLVVLGLTMLMVGVVTLIQMLKTVRTLVK